MITEHPRARMDAHSRHMTGALSTTQGRVLDSRVIDRALAEPEKRRVSMARRWPIRVKASDDFRRDGRLRLTTRLVGARPLPAAFACLLCIACAVASATWIWGFLHLSLAVTLVLWWWPSLLAGVLAGALFVAALEITRRLRSRHRPGYETSPAQEADAGPAGSASEATAPSN